MRFLLYIGDCFSFIAIVMLLLKILANKNVIGTFKTIQASLTEHNNYF